MSWRIHRYFWKITFGFLHSHTNHTFSTVSALNTIPSFELWAKQFLEYWFFGNTCSVNAEAIQISVSRRHGCIFHDTVYEKHRCYRFTGVIIRTFSRGYDKKGHFFIPKKGIIAEPKGIFMCPPRAMQMTQF